MKILFHENQLSYRGTSNAIYNYALFNQEYLNNESVIIYQKNNKNNYFAVVFSFTEIAFYLPLIIVCTIVIKITFTMTHLCFAR